MPQTTRQLTPAAPAPSSTGDPLLDMAHGILSGAPAAAAAKQSLSAQFDATPTTPPKAAAAPAPKAPSGPHETTPLDYAGAAVEPVLSLGTSMIAQPAGMLTRLGSAILGNTSQGALADGNKMTQALTYQPQTQGGQQAMAGLGNMANAAGKAVMASPVGPAISGAESWYNSHFVDNQGPLMHTVNAMVPGVAASILAQGAGRVAGSVIDGTAANKLATAIHGAPVPEQGSIPFGARTSPPATQPAPVKPNYRPNGDGTFTQTLPRTAPQPTPTPPSAAPTVPGATLAPAPTFEPPPLPSVNSKLAPDAQRQNIETMNAIGLTTQRPSAITGDKFSAGQEFQQSKLSTDQGEVMRDQLANEQAALNNYAQGLVSNTGAAATTPETAGQTMRAPAQALSDHFDNSIGQLYQAADQRAGGMPSVTPTDLTALLQDPTFRETLYAKGQAPLLDSVDRMMGRFQATGPDGQVAPATVQSAENFRQFLNGAWTPQTSASIGQLKAALDSDVMRSAGEDIYGQARALHAQRANTLDNPNGISSLINESGPNGINQQIPDEKVGQKLLSMPTGQLQHIVDTYKSLPPELQAQGQRAIGEMKGALAQQIYKAGDSGGTQNGPSVWNAANVTKALNANGSKIAILFSPEEIANFQTLNDAGHILQTPSAYPGAAVQQHNLLQRGALLAPPAIGGALGHAIGGIPGLSLGSGAGTMAASKMSKMMDAANANKLRSILANPKVIPQK